MRTEILNGRVIDPGNDRDEIIDLFIDDGHIIALGECPDGFKAEQSIDAKNLWIVPGLIDLRTRPREPGLEHKATIASETYAAARAGVTTFCMPPDSYPIIDTPAMAEFIQEQAKLNEAAFIHPLGAATQGLEGKILTDMAALADAGCVGVSNALHPIRDSLVLRRAMQYASTFDLTVFLHSQDAWLQGNGCVHEGKVSTRLGLPSIPEAAEIVGIARDLALVETTGVSAHFCGLSSARSVEMIAAAQAHGLPITADVNIHNLVLTEEAIGSFETAYHVIPPLRTEDDRNALRQAVQAGTISVICSDHQPHEADAKLLPFSDSEPGIAGIETLLPLTLQLVEAGVLDITTAIACLTSQPASILGVDSGHLGVGAIADICVINPDEQWQFTESDMLSAGKNNPFIGQEFKGRVVNTFINGHAISNAR